MKKALWATLFVLVSGCTGGTGEAGVDGQTDLITGAEGGPEATGEAADALLLDVSDARDALIAADQARSARAGSLGIVAGLGDAFTDNGVFLPRNAPPIRGKQAIIDYLAATYPGGTTTSTWTIARGDVSAATDLGYTFGWTRRMTAGDPEITYGQYLTVWRRQLDGSWKVAVDLRKNGGEPTAPPAWFTPITGDGPAHPCLVNVFKEKAALAAADTAFADLSISQGERTAFSTYVADDGVELAWDMAFGKEAVAAGHVDAPGSPGLDWQPTDADVALTGELGYTIGAWTYDYTDENGAPQIDHGKYLTVWQKKDGVWRFVVDGGNGSPPPSP